MKHLFLPVLFAVIFISCSKKDTESTSRNCLEVEYNSEISIVVSDEICFPDGNSLTLKDVEHQLCPCEVFCTFPGSLYIIFTTESEGETVEKKMVPGINKANESIFNNHKLTSISYKYGSEDEDVPKCAADFEVEKITLTLSISTN